MKKKIHQFSTINALMSGVFTGFFDIETVKKSGNFGLGCSDGLTGEVIINNAVFMEAKDKYPVRIMKDSDKLPFAQLTTFHPEKIIKVQSINKGNLYSTFLQHIQLDNIFLAIKIEGDFDQLKIRTPNDHGNIYKDAIDVSENQIVRSVSSVEGALIGFWTPKFFENISVAGFHLHFISSDGQVGGHVIDFELQKGDLSYESKFGLELELPNNTSYLQKDLNIENMSEIVKKVEN